eukprot:6182032-Pleurochrysis_carterae.AAC.2
MQVWKKLAINSITYAADEARTRTELLTVNRVGPVCAAYRRVAHGISFCTSNRLLADARAGHLRADAMRDEAGDHGNLCVDDGDAPTSIAKEI